MSGSSCALCSRAATTMARITRTPRSASRRRWVVSASPGRPMTAFRDRGHHQRPLFSPARVVSQLPVTTRSGRAASTSSRTWPRRGVAFDLSHGRAAMVLTTLLRMHRSTRATLHRATALLDHIFASERRRRAFPLCFTARRTPFSSSGEQAGRSLPVIPGLPIGAATRSSPSAGSASRPDG